MEEALEMLADLSDAEVLRYTCIFVAGIFAMKLAGALYNTAKVIHDWLASLFPTHIDTK